MRRKHFRCSACGQFVLWAVAEARLRSSAQQTLQQLSQAVRDTTNEKYIYVIRGSSEDAPPQVDLQGEAILREEALGLLR
jgi:hypothetical protein